MVREIFNWPAHGSIVCVIAYKTNLLEAISVS